jgi:replicative DNA helicase
VTLVYPDEANINLNRISILAPVGAALIGLSIGQTIEFQTPTRERRSLTVLGVSNLATGLPDLDADMGGLQQSDLIIIAGRPRQGKTALATNIATTSAAPSPLPRHF